MSRPAPETAVPGAVDRWLLEAEERLANAEQLADDAAIRDAIRAARKALKPGIRRARQVLKDAQLRGAQQQELL